MNKEIKMPGIGTTVDSILITKWLKNKGDFVKRGEPLFEVETDKASMEVESYIEGYLNVIVKEEGQSAGEGEVVAYIGGTKDDAAQSESAGTGKAAANDEEKTESGDDAPQKTLAVRISPMLKRLAQEKGVDIGDIQGSGANGLITREDIMAAAQKSSENKEAEREIIPFNRIEGATAKAMQKSKSEIPHVYFDIEVDASSMKELRRKSQKKYSYNAMIVYAAAKCLEKYPYVAARYDEKGRILAQGLDIGVAMADGNDLFVPVVRNTSGMDSVEGELQTLIKKVSGGSLGQEDMEGGVLTVTNLGATGLSSFHAIINYPEAAILAVGAIKDRAAVVNNEILIRPVATLTLSADHRVVNGMYAGKFLSELKNTLESIDSAFLEGVRNV